MNAVAAALLVCIFQVTLLSVLASITYLVLRRFGPRAGASVLLTSLASIAGLSLLAFSPWPKWTFAAASAEVSHASPAPAEPTAGIVSGVDGGDGSDLATIPGGSSGDVLAMTPETEFDVRSFARRLLSDVSSTPANVREQEINATNAVAWLVLLGLAVGVARLGAGVWAVGAYRRQSRRIDDPGLSEMVDLLQAELGCRRRPEVRESDVLDSAATVGWRQPVILLPPGWRQWAEAQLRVVLVHEMAHVRNNDFVACFLGQIGLALHFYHPLVHWLMARLRLEQELAADSAAAGLSGGRRSYLTILAEMALHQEDHNVGWPARAFLPAKTTFLRRIAVLRNSRFRMAPASTGACAAATAVTLLAGLLVVGLRPSEGGRSPAAELAASGGYSTSAPLDEIDLAYVPEDALIVMAVRPTVIMSRMEEIGLGELAKELTCPGGMYALPLRGIDMEGTEQVLGVTWKYEPRERMPQLGDRPVKLYVVRSHEPTGFESLIRFELPGAQEKRHQGQAYLVSPGLYAGAETCCFQPDDRTIVVLRGKEPGVRQIIEAGPGKGPAILTEDGRQMVASDVGLILADTARLRAHMMEEAKSGRPAPDMAILTTTVMLNGVNSMIVGLRFDDRLAARCLFTCESEEVAERVKQGVGALEVVARNFIETGLPDTPFTKALRPSLLTLIQSLKTRRVGSSVRTRFAVAVEEDWPERFGELFQAVGNQARRDVTSNRLKQLALAMHLYHEANKRFPPAVLYGPDGTTPYSWRVALLPHLGYKQLYDEYRFDEPWDGPNNRKLLERIPVCYRHPSLPGDSTNASYFVLTGPGTVFDDEQGCRFADILDGTSNTILLVEAKRDIPWTKPEDIPYDPKKPIPELGSSPEEGFQAALCDGSIQNISKAMPENVLRCLIDKADRTPIPEWRQFVRP